MGYSIITPQQSFVRFDGQEPEDHCIWGQYPYCLQVYAADDYKFQFVIQADTEAEADALCMFNSSGIEIGLVRECDQEAFDIEFTEQPERYRLSALQVLYNWNHGFPGFVGEYDIDECFYIRVIGIDDEQYCSNCFKRIGDPCFTSVIEYGNEENFAGFSYCNSEPIGSDQPTGSCDPTDITFTNKLTMTIPYTAGLKSMYGDMPTVQVWIYNGSGQLQNMGIVATFDTFPVNTIYLDFGGLSSGVVKIK